MRRPESRCPGSYGRARMSSCAGTMRACSSSTSSASATRSIATASRVAAQSLAAVCTTVATSSGAPRQSRRPARGRSPHGPAATSKSDQSMDFPPTNDGGPLPRTGKRGSGPARGPRADCAASACPLRTGTQAVGVLVRTPSDWSAPAHVASGPMPLGRTPKPAAPVD
jgi:hypothetical protein